MIIRRKKQQEQQEQQERNENLTKNICQNSYDDENSDYIVRINQPFGDRYIIKSVLGKGSFGQVIQAHDNIANEDFAIKIIKNKKPFYNQAVIEIQILEHMKKSDQLDRSGIGNQSKWRIEQKTKLLKKKKIVQLKRYFTFRDHLCLVFELLSINLYDLLRGIHFQGVSLTTVRKFAMQILHTLHFLSSSQVGVVHCDLKPENILLKQPKSSQIKVIDFGSSCHSSQKVPFRFFEKQHRFF